MYNRRELLEEIKGVETIKSLTQVYQEIAAISMLQVRGSVTKTRKFLEGVSVVYDHAKRAYLKKVQTFLNKNKASSNLSFIKRNGREVFVFISANQNLYGDLISKVFNEFIKDVRLGPASPASSAPARDERGEPAGRPEDVVVIGRIGRALVEAENLKGRVEYFDLADYKPEWTKIQEITNFISKYEKISVYYPEFQSLINQLPTKSDISGGATLRTPVGVVKDYIFEPTPEKILEFFETQVVANLLHQKVYEAQLSRFAARLLLMNQATQEANEKLEDLRGDFLKFKKYMRNKKQLATLSGKVLWEASL